MFAVIADGNRQHRVQTGDVLKVDYRAGLEKGGKIAFDRVLLANGGGRSSIGAPAIENATVEAEVLTPEFKGKKLEIQYFRRRKNSRQHTGHRQKYTVVRVTGINVPGLEVVEQKQDAAQ